MAIAEAFQKSNPTKRSIAFIALTGEEQGLLGSTYYAENPIIPDPEAEKGYFFRSDHFNFAKIGIPALYASGAYEGFEKNIEEIKAYNDYYRIHKYHQPSDEYHPETTELSGVQLDLQLLFKVGLKLSNEDYFPKWYERSEFKAAREQ